MDNILIKLDKKELWLYTKRALFKDEVLKYALDEESPDSLLYAIRDAMDIFYF